MTPPPHPGHLWLIGMMGSGKTTVGALVARRLGIDFEDTDHMVEAATAMRLPALWAIDHGATFRMAEAAAIAAVASLSEPQVVAAGGGAVLDPVSADLMRRSGTVVWLTASPPVLAKRVDAGGDRPLLSAPGPGSVADRLEAILAKRRERYAAVAHQRIATDDLTADRVADQVEARWVGVT
ncbi:MAG: shikimate kinase [Acidimicrobiia bacterium]